MKITATKLRQNLYRLLDDVIKTGKPIEIDRKGRILKIIPDRRKGKLSELKTHDVICGKPEDILKSDWIKEWDEGEKI